MSEAEILELTYFDTCKIIRKVSVKDATTGITSHSDVVVVDNIKCAVSKNNNTTNVISGEIGSIVSTYTHFVNPNIDIQAGDTVEVTNEIGEKTIYLASKPSYYESHRETLITERDRV